MNKQQALNSLDSVWHTIRETINDIEQGNLEDHMDPTDCFSGIQSVTRHWPIAEKGDWLKGIRDMYFDNVGFFKKWPGH